jgi:hypothetical protein
VFQCLCSLSNTTENGAATTKSDKERTDDDYSRGGDIIANTNPRKHSTFLPLALLDSVTNPFLKSTLICFVCNAVGFLISLTTGSHVHLDLIGTGAFALAALPNIASTIPHIQISSWAQGI